MQSAAPPIPMPTTRHGREVVLLAEHEASETGLGFLGTEHLLVAAVTLCEGMPRFRSVLDDHGVTAVQVRAATRVVAGAGAVDPSEPERVRCTPAAARILARSAQLAGPGERVRPHHVLLAVLDGIDDPFAGSATDVLDVVGTDPRRFRRDLGRGARNASDASSEA